MKIKRKLGTYAAVGGPVENNQGVVVGVGEIEVMNLSELFQAPPQEVFVTLICSA